MTGFKWRPVRIMSMVGIAMAMFGSSVQPGRTQEVRLDPAASAGAMVSLSTGYDRAILPISLTGAVALELLELPAVLGATWTLAAVEPDFGDQRGRIYIELDLSRDHGWMWRVAHGWAVTGTDNDAFSAMSIAADGGFTFGWSDPAWMAGAEVGVGLTIVSFLSTSEWARDKGGAPFEHGVRYASSWSLRGGVRAGGVVGPIEISFRAGWDRLGAFTITPPMYTLLGIGLRL